MAACRFGKNPRVPDVHCGFCLQGRAPSGLIQPQSSLTHHLCTRCILPDDEFAGDNNRADLSAQTLQLRWPWNGYYTGSFRAPDNNPQLPHALRPRLRWVPAEGATRYEVGLTRECTAAEREACPFAEGLLLEAPEGSEYTLEAPLEVSRVAPVGAQWLWRVRGCNEASCTAWSDVRYLNVGRLDHDYNGDGFGDMLVSAPGLLINDETDWRNGQSWGGLWAYLGGSAIPKRASAMVFSPDASSLGRTQARRVASIGDVNGDGYTDSAAANFLAQGPKEPPQTGTYSGEGAAWWWSGGENTSSLGQPVKGSWRRFAEDTNFGESMIGGLDLNGDGYDDFVVAAPGETQGARHEGKLYIYYGSSTGLPDIASKTLENPSNSERAYLGGGCRYDDTDYSSAHSSIQGLTHGGDIDGDGYPDVVARAVYQPHQNTSGNGQLLVLFGANASDSQESRLQIIDGPRSDAIAIGTPHAAGDINDDGFSDIILADHLRSRAQVFTWYGSNSGLGSQLRELSRANEVDEGLFSFAAGRLTNWFGARNDALYVPCPALTSSVSVPSRVLIYQTSDPTQTPDIIPFEASFLSNIPQINTGPSFASSTSQADFNGDGVDELIVGMYSLPSEPMEVDGETSVGGAVFVYQRRDEQVLRHFVPRPKLPDFLHDVRGDRNSSLFGFALAGAAYR